MFFPTLQTHTIHLNFVPSQEQMTMVMATTMTHPGAMIVGAVRVYALDTLLRTPLLTDTFNTDSNSIAPWRNSLLPSAEATATLSIGELSHDSTQGRMRVDMSLNPLAGEGDEPQLQGLTGRHYTQLQAGKDYQIDTDGAPEIDEVQLILFSAGRIASGFPLPDTVITLSSGTLPDTLHTTFTALSDEMLVYINVMRNDTSPYHYYLDNYALREGFTLGYNCDPDNLADVEDRWGYRYGFNGAEGLNELYGDFNAYDLGARMYSPRLGKMFTTDPREAEYPWQSTYAYYANNPIWIIDFNGEGEDERKDGFTNVVVISEQTFTDKAYENNKEATSALDKDVLTIYAKDQNDLFEQLGKIYNLKINNIIFIGHGDYLDPGFDVGDDYINKNTIEDFAIRLKPFLDINESSIVIGACHTGAGTNYSGERFSQSFANFAGVKVYANRTWGAASKERFVNSSNAEKPIYPNFLSVPSSYKSSAERDVAKQNLGMWTLAVPNASKIKIVERIFYYLNGNFYKGNPPVKPDNQFLIDRKFPSQKL